jgi:histidinol phosphatase-like enzyme
MKRKIICFDLDNVICLTGKSKDYKKSRPLKNNIKFINLLYDRGYKIIIFTARYMGRCNDDAKFAEKKIKPLTLKQLKNWGVKYNKIFFGKPSYDLFIDDKVMFFKKNWANILQRKLKL